MSTFTEIICPGVTFSVEPQRMIFAGETAYQAVHVFEHDTLGRVLALDNVVQTTESDEFIYHEMLTHTPMLAHGAAREVLIIGGGDGGIAREVLRHPVERVVMVELDGDIVRLCAEHLPALSDGAFDDPRLELVIGDGAAYVADDPGAFDVIIIDSTDPVGPGKVLFEPPFFHACRRALRDGGVLVNQNGTPAFMPQALHDSHVALGAVFARHGFYYAPVPTYVSGVMALGWASDSLAPGEVAIERLRERHARLGAATRWYTPQVHLAAFAEPPVLGALARGVPGPSA